MAFLPRPGHSSSTVLVQAVPVFKQTVGVQAIRMVTSHPQTGEYSSLRNSGPRYGYRYLTRQQCSIRTDIGSYHINMRLQYCVRHNRNRQVTAARRRPNSYKVAAGRAGLLSGTCRQCGHVGSVQVYCNITPVDIVKRSVPYRSCIQLLFYTVPYRTG